MNNRNKKVAVIYHHIPEFRKAIFEKLVEESSVDYVIVSDVSSIIPALKLVDDEVLDLWGDRHFKRVKNTWFGAHFLWQSEIARPSFIKKYDTLIYLGSMYHLSTWVSAVIAKSMGKKVVFWTHGLINREDDFKGFTRRRFYSLADSLLLYGHRAKNLLLDYGFSAEKLFVVYNSLDYEKQKKFRESVLMQNTKNFKSKCFKDPNLPIMIFIGRLTSEKQPELVIELAHAMKLKGNPINVLIVGDGPDLKDIKNLISQKNLMDNICTYGACHEEEELSVLLMGADLSIIPGFVGLAAMHYMAYGLPVITSNRLEEQKPEVEAILPGITGDFFEHGDVGSLVLVTEKWLIKERKKVRENCISMIENIYNSDVQKNIINHLCLGKAAKNQPVKELKI